MNRQLEELFNLDPADVPEEPVTNEIVPVPDAPTDIPLSTRIEQALPQVHGIGQDDEVDTIAQEAMNMHREIRELAMNVEPRHSAELLSVAAQLLKTALDAKQGKAKDKLAAVRLQIAALTAKKFNPNAPEGVTEAEGTIVGTRNQIIASLKKPDSVAK